MTKIYFLWKKIQEDVALINFGRFWILNTKNIRFFYFRTIFWPNGDTDTSKVETFAGINFCKRKGEKLTFASVNFREWQKIAKLRNFLPAKGSAFEKYNDMYHSGKF